MAKFHCNCGEIIVGTRRDIATHLAECATIRANAEHAESTDMPFEGWLTVEEVSHFILNVKTGQPGVSRARVQQLIMANRLPATMHAGRWFVKRADLLAFLEQERKEGRPRNE